MQFLLKIMKFKVWLWLGFILITNVFPKSISGKVVAITDGDTFVLLDSNKVQHKVRLAGIDAPEKTQDFGMQAKLYLSNSIFGKTIKVEYNAQDKYQRILGVVQLDSKVVNEEIIEKGLAWAYLKYLDNTNQHYKTLMETAQNLRIGLWSIPNAVATWDYRHSR